MTGRDGRHRRLAAIYLFAAWTIFVWGNRVQNVIADDGSMAALVVAAGMVVLGVAVAVTAVVGRATGQVVVAAAGATIVVWLVRAPLIVADADHDAAFKAVHTALALVSVVLALLALRTARALPSSVPGPARRPAPG